jgi:hypothetical protein
MRARQLLDRCRALIIECDSSVTLKRSYSSEPPRGLCDLRKTDQRLTTSMGQAETSLWGAPWECSYLTLPRQRNLRTRSRLHRRRTSDGANPLRSVGAQRAEAISVPHPWEASPAGTAVNASAWHSADRRGRCTGVASAGEAINPSASRVYLGSHNESRMRARHLCHHGHRAHFEDTELVDPFYFNPVRLVIERDDSSVIQPVLLGLDGTIPSGANGAPCLWLTQTLQRTCSINTYENMQVTVNIRHVMPFEEYVNVRHPIPYLYSIRVGASSLRYVGTNHLYSPGHPIFDTLRHEIEGFRPDLVLVEGCRALRRSCSPTDRAEFLDAYVRHSEADAIRLNGESGFAILAARAVSADVICPEPLFNDEVQALLNLYRFG